MLTFFFFSRVIFTVKNHAGVVLAQQITSSILITDDHKSSMATPLPIGTAHDIQLVGSGFQFPTLLSPSPYGSFGANIPSHDNQQFSPTNLGANTKGKAGAPHPPPYLQNPFPLPPFTGQGGLPGSPASPSGSIRMSPPAAQAPGANPSSKKRRINSVPKVPANLTMTRLDNQRSAFQPTGQTPLSGPAHVQGVPASSLSHFPTSQPPSAFWAEEPMTPSTLSDQSGFQLEGPSNNPFAPLDNRRQFTSPQSARASRAPSPISHEAFLRAPVGSRVSMPLQNQTRQIQPDVYQGHPHEPDAPPIPEISRLVPHEGTCRGGIEVTVLGRGFVEGLTVVFGDTPASYNLCFSATTMVCMLPPNASPGPVVVSLKNVQLRMGADKVRFFTYIDDADKALMELALQIVGMKMRGTMSNAQDIARSIIENSGSAFGQGSPQPSESGGGSSSQQHQQYLWCLAGEGGFGRQGLEEILMKFLDAIDIDDSPYPAPLNLIDKAGQTVLHLACMLGMERFVAALLARGVSPRIPDKNGYTALHFAALHRHAEIYRRLLLHNANPNAQTKNGDTPMDLALKARGRAARQTHSRHHSRANSTSFDFHVGNRSRASSTASLPSTRDSADHGSRKPMGIDDYFSTGDEVPGKDADENVREPWMHSRRGSRHEVAAPARENIAADQTTTPDAVAPQGLALAAATAWREHIAPSFQNLQNHWNLPTMPTAADYQHIFQNPMAAFQNPMARFHALMPPFPPFAQGREDGEYKWWELFSAPQAPPAYEELFPHPSGSAAGPAGDVLLERGQEVDEAKISQEEALVLPASSTLSSSASTGSASPPPSSSLDQDEFRYQIAKDVRELKEQQQEYRAHTRKMKRLENDRRLYFFWVSLSRICIILL